jgi:hypothetical protein
MRALLLLAIIALGASLIGRTHVSDDFEFIGRNDTHIQSVIERWQYNGAKAGDLPMEESPKRRLMVIFGICRESIVEAAGDSQIERLRFGLPSVKYAYYFCPGGAGTSSKRALRWVVIIREDGLAALKWSVSGFLTRSISRVWGNLMSRASGSWNQPYMPATINSGNVSGISHFERYLKKRLIIIYFESWGRHLYFGNFNPRALGGAQLKLHFVQLPERDRALLAGVMSSDQNSRSPYRSSKPEASDTRYLPKSVAALSGSLLIVVALIFLTYCVNRADYFILFGVIGGFLPFCLGFILIFFCFLPDPPPILGFSIGP